MTALNERYELGHRIGGGGMAEVVAAYDRELDRWVAVKLLRDGSGDPRARERFAREARMAAGFTHPNVVTVFDVGEADGRPYLVMELIDGRTLAQVVAEQGPLPVDHALAATDAVLAALSAAHERGLVHRDVKPANVLISGDGRVKLADFGIATAMQGASVGLTATGQMIGTPTYLSPEQVDGREATPRSDLYAVGVLLYELLAGTPPFRGEHAVAVALAHRDHTVPPLEGYRSDLPTGLADVVGRALEKDPSDRFADASQMRRALDAVRRGTPAPRADTTIADARPGTTQPLPAPSVPAAPAPGAPAKPVAVESKPRSTGSGPRTRSKGAVPTAAVLAVAALIGAGVAVLLSGGGDPSTRKGLGVQSVQPSAKATVSTVPPTTTTTVPTTLDGLVALVAADPDAYGPRGGDLLEGLLAVRDRPDPNGKRVERLASDIEQWVADGELDPAIGALSIQILGVTPGGEGGRSDED